MAEMGLDTAFVKSTESDKDEGIAGRVPKWIDENCVIRLKVEENECCSKDCQLSSSSGSQENEKTAAKKTAAKKTTSKKTTYKKTTAKKGRAKKTKVGKLRDKRKGVRKVRRHDPSRPIAEILTMLDGLETTMEDLRARETYWDEIVTMLRTALDTAERTRKDRASVIKPEDPDYEMSDEDEDNGDGE